MIEFFDDAEQAEDFVALAGVGENDHEVAGANCADIAVQGVAGMQEMTRGAGGGESGGQFSGNDAGLADAGGQDRAAAIIDELEGTVELVIEEAGDRFDSAGLDLDELAGELADGVVHETSLQLRRKNCLFYRLPNRKRPTKNARIEPPSVSRSSSELGMSQWKMACISIVDTKKTTAKPAVRAVIDLEDLLIKKPGGRD
jgi:hypothetical protein